MIFNRKPAFYTLFVFLSLVCLLDSCIPKNKFLFVFNRTSVKNPRKDTFVFANEIKLTPGIVSKDETKRLESELSGYWDDSVKAQVTQQYGIFYRVKDPQRFDSMALGRSKVFMNSYLQSQGYYNAVLKDTFEVDTFKFKKPNQQFRAIVKMDVNPGKRLRIDSFAFAFQDSMLQKLALQKSNETLLKKGDPYYKQLIANELDRLVAWFRQNGYYKLKREDLVAHVDTTDQLIDSLIIDPFELARKVAEAAERRRQNPTIDISIMQATQVKEIPFDSSVVTQYHIGNIVYYPETNVSLDIPDSLIRYNTFKIVKNDTLISYGTFKTIQDSNIIIKYKNEKPRFRTKPITRHTYVEHGELYNEKNFLRTINTFGQMGPWQQLDLRDSINKDSINFHIFLSPYKRYNYKVDLELTRSTGDFISSSNLFGIGVNASRLDRNFTRRAIQALTSIRAGVELNPDKDEVLLQTVQTGVNQTFSIPNLIWPNKWFNEKKFLSTRTIINLNAAYTDRTQFFRLRSITANLGSELNQQRYSFNIKFPIPNIEFYSLDTLPQLRKAFESNPFLRTAFNTGTIISWTGSGNSTWSGKKNSNKTKYIRGAAEWAGWPVLAFQSRSLEKNLYQYVKIEGEYIETKRRPKSSLVFRGLVGLGIGYNLFGDESHGQTLPFFKQFVAGGPNSMRAWGLRQLGLGSSLLSDTASGFKDRFGDLQLEGNVEYRFLFMKFGSVKWNMALFADAGNLWNLKYDPNNPKAQFKFQNLLNGDDIAIATGVGLARLDLGYFLIRLDFALKLRDPARRSNNGWLDFSDFTWKNKEYKNSRNNFAFQIGIGMPF